MTNIAGIRTTDRKGNPLDEIVMVADSMGSWTRTKQDDAHKLFHAGNFLITGSGPGGMITEVASILDKEHSEGNIEDVDTAASAVLQITNNFGLKGKDYLNFILSGFDKNGQPNLLHINTTGNTGQVGVKSNYSDRGIRAGLEFFDGSGSFFVNSYLKYSIQGGKFFDRYDLAGALTSAYDFAKTGAEDSGVNDKLQFGLITKNGISTLYHPDIGSAFPGLYKKYVETMLGFSPEKDRFEMDYNDWAEGIPNAKSAFRILNDFYNALCEDLQSHNGARSRYTAISEMYADEQLPKKVFDKAMKTRKEEKLNVLEGVEAFAQKGTHAIMKYLDSVNQRRDKEYKHALNLVAEK